jgi:hypothetical protein
MDIAGIAVDVACIFLAVLFTEFVQAIVYRSYGLRSTILVREFGGGVIPEAEPPFRIQRIVAALSNPASAWLLYALVLYSNEEYAWKDSHPYAGFAYMILKFITALWGILGLLPLYPYPGGRIVLEIFSFVSPRYGLIATLILSILVGLAVIADTASFLLGHGSLVPLFWKGLSLVMRVILGIIFAIATMNNWALLQRALAARRGQVRAYDDYEDDRAPWER